MSGNFLVIGLVNFMKNYNQVDLEIEQIAEDREPWGELLASSVA